MNIQERLRYKMTETNIENSSQNQSTTIVENIESDSSYSCIENKSNNIEEKLIRLLNEDKTTNSDKNPKKIKLEAMLLYYSINSQLVKIERVLRDAKNIRIVLIQTYDRAKENLMLHDRILTNQTNDARNYFGILCAIYDSVVKYTLPSARLITDLSILQSEIERKEKDINLMDTITDSLQNLPINFPKNMTSTKNSKDVTKVFEEMASFIEQNRSKYLNLEKKARDIYNLSLFQRDIIQKDITVILQNISENNAKIERIEIDHRKVKENMDKLLKYMETSLGIQIIENIPIQKEFTIEK